MALSSILVVALWAAAAPSGARAEYVRSHYTKMEFRVPMRDGKRLFTQVYIPNDGKDHPILLHRTPYGLQPYGLDRYKTTLGPTEDFEKSGYIFAFQDVRGRFMSEGTFVHMRPHNPRKKGKATDESSDAFDTIDWMVKNVPRNNGKVGAVGISYPGYYTSCAAIDGHPALKAVSPQAPIADWFWDDMHHHGAFVLPLAFNFMARIEVPRKGLITEWPDRFDHKTADGYAFFMNLGPLSNANKRHFKGDRAFWNDLVAHPNYDEFWQSRNILPHLKGVKAATLVVGGLFDTEDLFGTFATYQAMQNQNPKADVRMVVGPWMHGGWLRTDGKQLGGADFGFKTAQTFRDTVELPFFEHHLKDAPAPDLPEALVFETGANRWRRFEQWPPKKAQPQRLHMASKGRLSVAAPTASSTASERFISDPAKPVPYTMEVTNRWAKKYMTEDQRFASWRPDVLVYRSEPLTEAVTVAGNMSAHIWLATTGTDADVVVKVIDELPGRMPGHKQRPKGQRDLGGTQQLVRGEVMRGRFRRSYEAPEAFVPNEPSLVRFELHDVLHTFKRGHRIMIQVQSSWFPFIDRNPQTYVESIFNAKPEDFQTQTHRVYRGDKTSSRIEFRILPRIDGLDGLN